MEKMPENEFGLLDLIAIGIFLFMFTVFSVFMPDQTYISEEPTTLLIIRLALGFLLGAIAWIVSIKILIPSDKELMDFNLKRQIDGGIEEIREDAANIKALSFKFAKNFPDKARRTAALGETIERIMTVLVAPDLGTIAKIEGKLTRFLEILSTFQVYASGSRRTTQAQFNKLSSDFESALQIATTAFDNMELDMSDPNLSRVTVLTRTLEDLSGMDGLLQSRSTREESEVLKTTEDK